MKFALSRLAPKRDRPAAARCFADLFLCLEKARSLFARCRFVSAVEGTQKVRINLTQAEIPAEPVAAHEGKGSFASLRMTELQELIAFHYVYRSGFRI